jgi:hypothetical protein
MQGAIDLNSLVLSGVYRLGSSNPNLPSNCYYGNVLVMHGADDTMSQIYGDWSSNNLYVRGGNPTNIGGGGSLSSWQKLYHSGNLTNNLSTNYIPKWNGSSFVNSLISANDDYIFVPNSSGIGFGGVECKIIGNSSGGVIDIQTGSISRLFFNTDGHLSIPSTIASTSPTTGALVVGGGIGVGGSLNIFANASTSSITKAIDFNGLSNISSYNNGGYRQDVVFNTSNGDGSINLIEAFRAKWNGNFQIGYGATDQGYKLAVNGTGYFSSNFYIGSRLTIIPFENNSTKITSSSWLTLQDSGGAVGIGYTSDSNPGIIGAKLKVNGSIYTNSVICETVSEYADNAAAVSAGLAVGTHYRTGDLLKIVH